MVKHEVKNTHDSEGAKCCSGHGHKMIHKLVIFGLLIAILVISINTRSDVKDMHALLSGDEIAAEKAAPAAAAPLAPSAPSGAPTVNMALLIDDDAVKGDPNAPVTIVEWSDFECPFCARFYRDTLSQIDEQYIKTGKVKLVYRDFPLSFHQNAQKAAEAAECAGEQGKYWEMHDALFDGGVVGGVAIFKQYAANIGLNTATFNSCLDSGQMASETAKDMADGGKVGITGTPGFIINGKLVSGAQPFSVFQQAIDAALNS